MFPRSTAVAAFAFGLLGGAPACIPTPDHPSSNYDASPLTPFDATAEDRPPVDVPPVDRPVPTDRGFDAGAADVPAVPTDGPDPTRTYPRGPYGAMVGDPFPAFAIANCAGGTYQFAGPDWIPARASVVELTVGYCADCLALSSALQAQVAGPYRLRGVRVVGVLTGGASPDMSPTTAFCTQWISQAHIEHPMALDLGNDLGVQTFSLPLPQWVLVDSNGIILWRAAGSTASLSELTHRLTALVGAP